MLRAVESRREVRNLEEGSVASTPGSTRPPSPLLRSFAGMALTSSKPAKSNPIAQKSTSADETRGAPQVNDLNERLQDIKDDVALPRPQDESPPNPDSGANSGAPSPPGGLSRKGSQKRPHLSAMGRPSSVSHSFSGL